MWIEIWFWPELFLPSARRGSREPCGLKLELGGLSNQNGVSRLARALWIEIVTGTANKPGNRRGSREPCGLKSTVTGALQLIACVVEARESLVD